MPKTGMAQEVATVLRWLHGPGDRVEQGTALLEVETDKVVMEVEAPASGILGGVRAQAGDVVPVTSVIAFVLQPGEEPPGDQPSPKLDGFQEIGLGEGKRRATPAARSMARQHGLDLAQIRGSGPRGRVQSADVRAVVEQMRLEVTPQPILAAPPPAEVLPLQGMRRTIAARMQHSYQTTPHIMLTVEADMAAAQALRHELNGHAEAVGAPHVSVTAILVKVCAWALRRHRRVNASLLADGLHVHESVNIGVAVALDEGLIVPVICQAERLGIGEIAGRLDDLTDRARQGRLTPDEVSGGTFTISNLGMYNIDHFTAIINPPESALLAVGRIAKRAVVERASSPAGEMGDEVVVRPMMHITLAADHRVLDGAVAARFLGDVVNGLEHPSLLLW
jgi:pyruvate dehydrogenase E2 component (dihydrolipoamide acetyltransferase)